jgi:hypothetical protein
VTAPVTSAGLVGERWVRFEAVDASPYELARYWAERVVWPDRRSRVDELHELAVMSRLADWCWRWQPIVIHRAVLVGAVADEVAAACGTGISSVESRWRRWMELQRAMETMTGGDRRAPGPVEVARVAAVLCEWGAKR